MTGKQAKELFIKYGENQFNEIGFHIKKTRDIGIEFYREIETGFEEINIGTLDYNPVRVFQFSIGKRVNALENIVKKLPLTMLTDNEYLIKEMQNNTAISLYYLDKNDIAHIQLRETARTGNESEVNDSISIILKYIKETALPNFQLFNNLKNIDNLINGDGENFWEDDIPKTKPFNLAHLFYPRRLIIAKLAKSAEEYNRFIEKIMALEEEKLIELKKQEQYKNLTLEELFIPRAIEKIEEIC